VSDRSFFCFVQYGRLGQLECELLARSLMLSFPSVPLVSMLYKFVCVTGLVNTSKYMTVFIFSSFGIVIIIFF
jgi:hypothetical protein